jgi:hypothetical protein
LVGKVRIIDFLKATLESLAEYPPEFRLGLIDTTRLSYFGMCNWRHLPAILHSVTNRHVLPVMAEVVEKSGGRLRRAKTQGNKKC